MESVENNKALVHKFYDEFWNNWNYGVIGEILAQNVAFLGSFGSPQKGHEGIIQYAELVRSAFPDFHNTVEDLIAEGNKVAACLTHRGTHHGEIYNVKPTGRKVHYIGTAIFVFRDGLIGNAWVLSDRLELLQQLGGPEPDDSGLEI